MLVLFAGLAAAPAIFLSPVGDDRAAGTQKAPMRTVAAAITRIRPRHAGGRFGRIVLKAGVYPIAASIAIGDEDSGLTIVSESPGKARLLGGRILKRWKPAVGMDPHVVVCDLAKDEPISDLGEMSRAGFSQKRASAGLELFSGGKPMPLARYPNVGWLRTGAKTADQSVTYDGDRASRWRSKDDVWAMGYWMYDWAETYERVGDIEAGKFSLKDKPPFGAGPGRRFYFLNVREELDSPGEWYLDRPNRQLYFWPTTSAQPETIASTLADTMFKVKGASRITLKGLSLEVGRGSGIVIEGGAENRIEGCLIRNFGLDGVTIENATHSGVSGCDLTGLGDRAITLRGGDRKSLVRGELYAEDNEIWAYSRWSKTYNPAIGIDGVGNRAERNRIHDAPHNAILASGNDHLLANNDVYRVCLETGDAGAFYFGRNPTMRGTVIRNNWFHDLGAKVTTDGNFTEVMSVYLDDGFAGTTIADNLFEGPGTGIMLGGGQDNVVRGNVFIDKHPAVHLDARCRGWAKDMVVNPTQWNFLGQIAEVDATHGLYAQRYPRLRDVLERGFGDPTGTKIEGNLILGPASDWLRLQDGLKPDEFKDNLLQPEHVAEVTKKLHASPEHGKIGPKPGPRPISRVP